jgi:hypothetical protein
MVEYLNMGKENIKEYDKSYHPPETIQIEYCAAVLGVVFRNHPKAKDLIQNIRDCALLPGVQDTFFKLEHHIPEGDRVLKGIASKAGYNKHSKIEGNSAIVTRKLIVGFKKFTTSLSEKLMFTILINRKRRHDLKVLTNSIDNFIRVCFNSESARVKGKYRMTGDTSHTLLTLIMLRVVLDTNEKYNSMFKRLVKIPMHRHGQKLYSVGAVLDGKMPDLAQRSLVKQYMEAGFKLKHNKVIETKAWRWYQCRVVHDGPTEYFYQQMKQTSPEDKEVVEPENLLHELKEFDEALGYTREKTGKRKS